MLDLNPVRIFSVMGSPEDITNRDATHDALSVGGTKAGRKRGKKDEAAEMALRLDTVFENVAGDGNVV
jgi:hypothetical protein